MQTFQIEVREGRQVAQLVDSFYDCRFACIPSGTIASLRPQRYSVHLHETTLTR